MSNIKHAAYVKMSEEVGNIEVRELNNSWLAGGRCGGLGLQEALRQISSLSGGRSLHGGIAGPPVLLAQTLVGLLLPLPHRPAASHLCTHSGKAQSDR